MAVFLLTCRGRLQSWSTSRPDILLVSIDSLRADHLGCYGYGRDTSPTVDRLAAEGVRFSQAVSSTSWTLPAHAALFTGLEEQAHGLTANGLRLSEAQVTAAEMFRDLEYQTAGFFAGPYLHPAFGLAQGFESYLDCMVGLNPDLPEEEIRAAAASETGETQLGETGSRTERRMAEFLSAADTRPAFLFVHLWDVHYDYAPPPPWDRYFDPDYAGSTDFSRVALSPAIHAGMDPADRRHLESLYDGEIRWTDSVLERLLALHGRLREGRERLVVVLSDHGEEFFEHGGKGHQNTLFEEVVRIPMVLHWPGHLPTGLVVTDLVRIIDVLPTLLDLVGARSPESLDGRSLAPLWRGETLEEVPALLWLRADPTLPMVALRSSGRKLILAHAPVLPAQYDLRADPGELEPLRAASELERAGLGELRRRVAKSRRYLERRPEKQPVGMQPSDEVADQLLALGYLAAGEHR